MAEQQLLQAGGDFDIKNPWEARVALSALSLKTA